MIRLAPARRRADTAFSLGRRRALAGGAALLASAALAACSSHHMIMTTERADPVSTVAIPEAQAALNAVRAELGLPPLTPDPLLQVVAEQQARLMAEVGIIDHDLPNGEGFTVRLRQAGYYGAAGENLAGGAPTLASAIDGWMRSPSHRRTMVNPDYVKFGIAVTRGPSTLTNTYGTYWALVMGLETPDWFVPPA